MRDSTIAAVQELLGRPDPAINDNEKVHRWHVNDRLDVIVQRDGTGTIGKVWVPASNATNLPESAELYPVGKGRQSGTIYSGCPSLAADKPVFCLTLTENGQRGPLVRFLKALMEDKADQTALAKRDWFRDIPSGVAALIRTMSFASGTVGLLAALGVGAGLPAAAAAAIPLGERAAGFLDKRRAKKRGERLEQVVKGMLPRLAALEERELSEEQADSFLVVLDAAADEDDEQKGPIYEAMAMWVLEKRPPAAEVRIMLNAVRAVTYMDIWCFTEMMKGHTTKPIDTLMTVQGGHSGASNIAPWFDENTFWNRLVGLGLAQQGVRMNGSPSHFGTLLKNFCGDKLPLPKGTKTR